MSMLSRSCVPAWAATFALPATLPFAHLCEIKDSQQNRWRRRDLRHCVKVPSRRTLADLKQFVNGRIDEAHICWVIGKDVGSFLFRILFAAFPEGTVHPNRTETVPYPGQKISAVRCCYGRSFLT